MDIKLFFSTFALIFLAELGDKTQLAALASSAGSRSPWSVFAGAAAALVISTLVAVLLGSTLQKYLPQHYLKGGAAILFLLFGTLLLINAIRTSHGEKPAIFGERKHSKPGILAKIALSAAREFEKATATDYASLALKTENKNLSKLFIHLAEEENSHLKSIAHILENHADVPLTSSAAPEISTPLPGTVPMESTMSHILASAIQHEADTVKFYDALASSISIPSVKNAFEKLVVEEKSHIAHLDEFVKTGMFEA